MQLQDQMNLLATNEGFRSAVQYREWGNNTFFYFDFTDYNNEMKRYVLWTPVQTANLFNYTNINTVTD